MAISQNFKTQVVFGGRIDPSFRRGTTELNDAIRQTSSTVGKLTKSQDKLKDKIAAMKLAGKDVSDLSAQYQKLDRRIKATTQDQEALNTQLAKKQRLEKWTGRAKGAAKYHRHWRFVRRSVRLSKRRADAADRHHQQHGVAVRRCGQQPAGAGLRSQR